MKPITTLTPNVLADIKLISFDADGVLIEKGTEILEKNRVLTVKTKKISPALLIKLDKLKKHFHINVSSGRSLLYLKDMFDQLLWNKSSLQGENGIFTLIDGQVIQNDKLTDHELSLLREMRIEIEKITDDNIRGFEPKQFLISVHCFKKEPQIAEIVKKIDLENEFYLEWNSEAYDIFPKRFSKGSGLKHLADDLRINVNQILVVGNDPNDQAAVEGSGLSVTTSSDTLKADYHTEGKLDLGGEELVDHLLTIYR